ncbi:hypothetical protein [Calothrix sp. NIES-3974]|uniref:hypothetical protein n=1 Tax=Calothrix sp. NIES-3974 TaxID=2005462 RepID=UPI000B60E7A3|nr:hypothetical protein [Calothrix sp. NIES-3974]BAZ03695.1 hypothetical protein NIES3974_03240 [Calothrix sp. NIES-3974]
MVTVYLPLPLPSQNSNYPFPVWLRLCDCDKNLNIGEYLVINRSPLMKSFTVCIKYCDEEYALVTANSEIINLGISYFTSMYESYQKLV